MVHQARKRFGQNFLQDTSVIDRIVSAVRPQPGVPVVEIGPGRGALTEALLEAGARVIALELDRDLPPILRARLFRYNESQLTLINADALKTDLAPFADVEQGLQLTGNLPYNISTPLIFHALEQRQVVRDMHFMLQKEVVDRLGAGPGDKTYGRLSVMVQYYCAVVPLFTVPPGAFLPPPKVDSAVVRLVPHADIAHPADDENRLSALVRQAFSQRRKTIRNNMKGWLAPDTLTALGIDPTARPETLTVDQFVTMSNALPPT